MASNADVDFLQLRARELLAGRGSQEAVNRLLRLIAERESDDTPRLTRIPIRLEGRTVFVKTEEVDWIEAAGNYMVVHAGSDNHILRETMAALEQPIAPNRSKGRAKRRLIRRIRPTGAARFLSAILKRQVPAGGGVFRRRHRGDRRR